MVPSPFSDTTGGQIGDTHANIIVLRVVLEANIQLLDDFVNNDYKPTYAVEPWKKFTPYKIMAFIEANREDWLRLPETTDNRLMVVIKRHNPPENPHPIGLEWTIALHRATGHIFVHLHHPLTAKKINFKSIKKVLAVNMGEIVRVNMCPQKTSKWPKEQKNI